MSDDPADPFMIVALDELAEIAVAGVRWRPLRRTLGLTAFGTNAYAGDAGQRVIEEHDEADSGEEELYLVIRGAARFTVGDQERDAPAGTVVSYADPGLRRGAVATADGTLVLAVGGRPGAHPPPAWEHRFAAMPAAERGDWASAASTVREALAHHPDDGRTHYDMARYLARGGDEDAALTHLWRAVELLPGAAERAVRDHDLSTIRDRPGFPAAP